MSQLRKETIECPHGHGEGENDLWTSANVVVTPDLSEVVFSEEMPPYHGVEGSVCEGCIYAKGINEYGEGCGRLFIESFRRRYTEGRCEYRKSEFWALSEFEERDRDKKMLEKERAEKANGTFALNILKKFVAKRLDGDIRRLKYFDFDTLKDDSEFGDDRFRSVAGVESMLMKAVVSLAFAEAYDDLSYLTMERPPKYKADTINVTYMLFGLNYRDLRVCGIPVELQERAKRFGEKVCTIGNIMASIPGFYHRDTKALGYGYIDAFLIEFYKMMIGAEGFNVNMLYSLGLKRKEVAAYRNEENFHRIVRGLMLEDFLDQDGKPKRVFRGLYSFEKTFSRETYFEAVSEFLDFCEPFIDKRADRIIEKPERILMEKQC